MSMTPIQKEISKHLLGQSYDHGFGSSYPLHVIADKLGIDVGEIYDNETNTGHLWEFGPHGKIGLFDFHGQGRNTYASVSMDTLEMLENACNYRR